MKKEDSVNIISSRIRLARNFEGLPFASLMTKEQKNNLKKEIHDAVKKDNKFNLDFIDMEQVTDIQAGSMVEDHLISLEFANKREGSALLLNKYKSNSKTIISVMLNEEDHLRIQVLSSELELKELSEIASQIDDYFDNIKPYAYSENLGYLTCCPTNLGIGMRASVMLHLPALTESGYIEKFVAAVSGIGLTFRGLYGEGTKPAGCIYQLSNQISLGITEEEAIERLNDIVVKLIENEKIVSDKLMENITIKDRLYRSYGVLKEARILSSQEFLTLMSDLRWAACVGLISFNIKTIDRLFPSVQPYNLILAGNESTDAMQRDINRAVIVRDSINNKNK